MRASTRRGARPTLRAASAVAGFVIAITVAHPVRAQDAVADAGTAERVDLEARRRFEAGRLAFEAGRFEDALADFRRAYDLSGRADLLYNIGQAADRLRRDREAVDAFGQYLREAGQDAAARAEVEARVRVLRSAIEERERDPAPEPSAQPVGITATSPAEPALTADATPWVVLASGVVVVAAGAAMLGIGLADRASVEGAGDGASWSALSAAADRGPVLEAAGGAALGVGAIAMVITIVWTAGMSGGPSDHVTACGVGACVSF